MKIWKFGTRLAIQEERIYGGETIKVVDVPGDGNCLFYSVTQQLSGALPEITHEELNGRLQEYLDLNARISDEPAGGMVVTTHYVQITPTASQDSTFEEELPGGGGGGDVEEVGATGTGAPGENDSVFYGQNATTACSSMIFRETTV